MSSGFFDQFSGGSTPNEGNGAKDKDEKWKSQKRKNKKSGKKFQQLEKILGKQEKRLNDIDKRASASEARLDTIEGFLRAACGRQSPELGGGNDLLKLK